MPISKGSAALVAEANDQITTYTVAQVRERLANDARLQLVDIRDVRELEREGKMPGAFHCPRGMLEFWIDPESPYHKSVFAEDKLFLFYCASGWRSALATKTALEMGLENVCHLEGGFTAWRDQGLPVEPVVAKTKVSRPWFSGKVTIWLWRGNSLTGMLQFSSCSIAGTMPR